MKRITNLMEQIAEPENLRLAFWKAARGKRGKIEVRRFAERLEDELERMREGLLRGNYPIGQFHRFVVHDPKRRVIHAAAFSERVLHHAMMTVCEPVFERLAIADSYACRRGKGQWAAVARAKAFARRWAFFLKLDIRRYFDSVSHERLNALLARRFKDRALLAWLARVIGSYQTGTSRGLPIGSLTSQHLANFYLDPLDRLVKETLRCRGYVRYMDDSVLWGESADDLRQKLDQVSEFLENRLGLCLKDFPYINRTRHGMDFLGCRVFPGYTVLNQRSRQRFRGKHRSYEGHYQAGRWDEATLQRHAMALLGFAQNVCSWRFRRRVIGEFGQRSIGLEPSEPGRELEQRRAELPLRESQQEHPVQQEPEPRFPCRPSSDQGRMAGN